MAHIFRADGRSCRLRLFPRPKHQSRRRKAAPQPALSLFAPLDDEDLNDIAAERLAAKVAELCLRNRNNSTVLDRMLALGLRDWWLVSESLFQSVWNLRCGRTADGSITSYDVFYFSEDPSWEAEDQVIRDAAALFAGSPVSVRLRNQARAHFWFPEKFGVAYPPLTTAG